MKIIVADDHEDILRALTWWFGRTFEVIGVANESIKLVDRAISLRPDVIVSDVMMPRMSGPQALQELTARGGPVPIPRRSFRETVCVARHMP